MQDSLARTVALPAKISPEVSFLRQVSAIFVRAKRPGDDVGALANMTFGAGRGDLPGAGSGITVQ